jgi:heme-degrading monooxygenase HmoA
MIARVTTVKGQPGREEEAITQYRDQVLPAVKGQAGYKGALLLIDRRAGTGISISLWESEEAQRASEAAVTQLRQQAAQQMGATQAPSVDIYEVAVQD